ncbi:MAG TPA: FAD/NAD(P)-binding oxidoreductase, partial [Clostridiales bacterium]|nr:FAD/NAD(P)-binding oxidoreductase [Clostridiales bacterium]
MKNMAMIDKINAKLQKAFGGRVSAHEAHGCVVLTGALSHWDDIVRAGQMAVHKKRYIGVLNDITYTGKPLVPPRMPALRDGTLEGLRPDVLVIGGGVIGCAIARELTRYKLDVLLAEKEHDLAMQASGRNDGMVHAGIDLSKHSQKYRYNMAGNRMYEQICAELEVEFKRCGQYICFNGKGWKPLLYLSLLYWKWLGLPGVKVLNKRKLNQAEPSINSGFDAALFFPSSGVVCPFGLTVAYAENAVQNGARVSLDTAVLSMRVKDGAVISVQTNRGTVYPRVVVNAAGVFCDDIAQMAQDRFYSIHPRKGTNAILDKKHSDSIVRTVASSIGTVSTKTAHSKGGGVVRTVHGNALIGPDAAETPEKENYATTPEGVRQTFARQGQTSPALNERQIITYFTGVRAPTYEEDFVVCTGKFTKNMVHAAGIQSPGLTAAPAIGARVAELAVELLEQHGTVARNEAFDPHRKAIPKPSRMDDRERAALIRQSPDYGVIVCRCEEVSKGEVLDAL